MSVDVKLLIEQEPEFKQFLQETVLAVLMADNTGIEMAGAVYNFYNIGLTPQQVADWLRGMQRFTND